MIISKPFYYVRHGETEWNTLGILTGQTDVPLNENGLFQAHVAQQLLQNKNIKTICYSPLRRARHTAQVINEALQCKLVKIEDLKECHWGPYEGKHKTEWPTRPLWWKSHHIEHVESYKDACIRVKNAINQALSYEGPVLIVAHGAVYRILMHHFNLYETPSLPNGVPHYIIPFENNRWNSNPLSF